MEDVLTRRFRNYLRERDEGAHAGKRFAYPPNLLLIDGGKGQLGVAVTGARRARSRRHLRRVASPSASKRCTCPGRSDPIVIPRDSEALYLLQQVRDEAHRFAITYHRQLRDKKMITSVLDDVPGLGPTRKKRLLKEFGSVKKMRELDEEQFARAALAARPGRQGRLCPASRPGARDDGEAMISLPLDVTIITGMSGAGRSEAAHVLEDLGYFVIDNLPPMLIGKVAELARSTEKPIRYALVVDVRSGDFLHDLSAGDRRAAPQRRAHPRALPRRVRRRARAPLRGEPPPASAVRHRPRQRRHRARARAARAAQGRGRPHRRHVEPQRARAARPAARAVRRRRVDGALQVNVVSFGYKHGLPIDVDLVFDCRFLPNPHWVDELRPLTGLDAAGARLRARAARAPTEFLDAARPACSS